MTFSYIVTFATSPSGAARIDAADLQAITELVRQTPGLRQGHVYLPTPPVQGPFANDGPFPQLVLQLYFDSIEEMEAALTSGGHLQALASPTDWPSLADAEVTQQAVLTRRFPVPHPHRQGPSDQPCCTYLVHYPGAAEDLNVWLRHYVTHHPQIMAKFPGIRGIEILTRVDWVDSMPWRRVHHMQRNHLAFGSHEALSAALTSPVMAEMRADFHGFPPFSGGNLHYPMSTLAVL